MKIIKTPTQKRWARQIFASGLQRVANAAFADGGRAFKHIARLELLNVIQQWVVETDYDVYELEDPESGAPLFVAGERWGEFVAEARKLGLVEVSS